MGSIYHFRKSLLTAAAFLSAVWPGLAQDALVVVTGPAHQPYNLLSTDTPVTDSFTIGSQVNGQNVSGVTLLAVSNTPWLTLATDCSGPGSASVTVISPATVSFCVDPSKTQGNGYYVDIVQITAPFDNSYPILYLPVNLTRFPTGDLSPEPASITLTTNQTSAPVAISEDSNGVNAQGGAVTVAAQMGLPNPPLEGNWLQYTLKNGSVAPGSPGEIDIQAVAANLTSQAPANYVHTVVLTDSFGDTKAITVYFNVLQPVIPPPRSFAHIAPQPSFATEIILTNSSAQPATFTLNFYHDDGSAFALPVTTSAGTLTKPSINDSINPFGTNYYDVANAAAGQSNEWGSAQLIASSAVTGVALFRNVVSNEYYEAAVPLSAGSSSFAVPFDLTTSPVTGQKFVSGIALANLDPSNQASVNCTTRDGSGNPIPNGSLTFALAPNGHTAEVLNTSVFGGTRGSASCTSNTGVSAISLRFLGNEFTTLPVFPTQ